MSGECELDFDLGMRSNLDSTRALLDALRASGQKSGKHGAQFGRGHRRSSAHINVGGSVLVVIGYLVVRVCSSETFLVATSFPENEADVCKATTKKVFGRTV